MKKCLLSAATAILAMGGSVTASAEKWVLLTDMNRVNFPVEVVIGYTFDGKVTPESGSLGAPRKAATYAADKPGDVGVAFSGIMNNQLRQTWQGAYLTQSIFGLTVVANEAVTEINDMPGSAAIVRLDKAENGYSLYLTNGEENNNGYLVPAYPGVSDKRSMNGLGVAENPIYASISETGQISFNQNDRNILTYTKQAASQWGTVNSSNVTLCFSSMDQGEGEGNNRIFVRESDLKEETAAYEATPASGQTIASFEDFSLAFNFTGEVTKVALSNDATDESIAATWNGEPCTTPSSAFNTNPLTFSYRSGYPTGEGLYTLHIAAGTFEISYSDGTVLKNPEMEWTVNVGSEPLAYTVTPADGSEVESFYQLRFKFGETSEIKNIEPVEAGKFGSMTFNGQPYTIDNASMGSFNKQLQLTFVEIAEPGEIAWEIKPGTFRITKTDGTEVYNTYMKGSFTVVGVPEVDNSLTIQSTPAKDATVYELKTFEITMPDAKTIDYPESEMVSVMSLSTYETFDATLDGIKGNTATFSLESAVTEEGTYMLMMNEGAFKVVLSDGKTVLSPETTISFNIQARVDQNYTVVSPAAGAYDSYPEVTLRYDDATAIEIVEGNPGATLYVGDINANNANKASFTIKAGENANEIVLVPESEVTLFVTEYTKYNLVVPENCYKLTYNDKQYANEEVTITEFTVINPAFKHVACTTSINEGQAVGKEQVAKVTVNVKYPVQSFNMTKKIILNKIDADGNATKIDKFIYSTSTVAADKLSFEMTFTDADLLENGNYQIYFPKEAYYLLYEGKRTGCGEQTINFTISDNVAVEGIGAETATYDVYTTTGVCVGRGLDSDALGALAKGLYIINGRKVVIR